MSSFQLQILVMSLGILGSFIFLVYSVTTVRYQITPRHLRVSWMGMPVRWVRLDDIRHVGTRPVAWAERWPNVLFGSRRTLVIRRRRGFCKNLLITPSYPYEFKTSLEQARENFLKSKGDPGGGPNPGSTVPPSGQRDAA
jgi:hypothetical protein